MVHVPLGPVRVGGLERRPTLTCNAQIRKPRVRAGGWGEAARRTDEVPEGLAGTCLPTCHSQEVLSVTLVHCPHSRGNAEQGTVARPEPRVQELLSGHGFRDRYPPEPVC